MIASVRHPSNITNVPGDKRAGNAFTLAEETNPKISAAPRNM
jgi:hypothetical protein